MSLKFKRKRRTENAPVSVKASGAADAASEVRKIFMREVRFDMSRFI
ncbi:MAG: hypothetical protein K5744_06385 [Eubacterium sp.]|nr:hypothetical protein [Eubacterium sp.]